MQIGFLGILGIIFIVLKLVGTIDWSWWLVLLPIYGGFVLAVVFFLVVFFLVYLVVLFRRGSHW